MLVTTAFFYFGKVKNQSPFSTQWWQGKSLWILLPAILVFIAGKWHDLALPLFWDELGVYGRGILYMVDHGPGLLPSALPPELSRGHPLLFYFLFSLVGWISDFSLPLLHGMALVVTAGLFFAVYFTGKKYWGEWAGLGGALLLMVNPAIFAQASLILPEMMLSLFCFLALFAFFENRFRWYFALGALAMMTKESAIVLPAAMAAFALLTARGQRIRHILVAVSPLAVFALFLLIQRMQNGWWFFPYHVELISFDPEKIGEKLGRILNFIFVEQGRIASAILLSLGLIAFLALVVRKTSDFHPLSLLLGIFFLGWLGFSVLNFYMDRYYLTFFPVIGVFAGAGLKEMGQALGKWKITAIIPLAIALILPLFQFSTPKFRYDVDINYRQLIHVQTETTHFLEKEVKPGELFFANFPLYNGFLDHRYGYMETEGGFKPTVVYSDTLRIAAIFQPPLDAAYTIKIAPEKEIRRFEDGYAKAIIYWLRNE
ncbi:MAG: glycosyltransferase family 39 protein [Bacteroidia bacterium]